MLKRRRLIAFFAALCVAWTALWPLVSAAHAAAMNDAPEPLCHQAGSQVAMGEMPVKPGAPDGKAKLHCPLCVMAFYGAFGPELGPAARLFSCDCVTLEAYCPPHRAGLEVQLPQSRAPPARS